MAQLALGVVGGVIGFYAGGPVGAQIGFAAGSMIGAVAFAPEQDIPKVSDLKAPQVQYGTTIPRLYGSNRTSGTLAWYSPKRVVPGDSGGKGTPTPPTADTAEIDLLYILSADSDVIAVTRVWINGELKWTNHSSSDDASVAASESTEAWASIDFLDGNPAQLPHPVIEATEGAGNVPAYRHRQCVLIESLQLGQSGQMPLIEFECITEGTQGDAQTRLQSYLTSDSTTDISAYQLGDGVLTNALINQELLVVNSYVAGASTLVYTDAHLASDGSTPITIECFATWISNPNIDYTRWLRYEPGGGDQFNIGYVGDQGQVTYDDLGLNLEFTTPEAIAGRAHYALVLSATSLRFYINGVLRYQRAGNVIPTAGGVGMFQVGDPIGYSSGTAVHFSIDEFAVRFEEQYTTDFAVPEHIKPPDGMTWTPGVADLSDIVQSEWTRCGSASQVDSSDLSGIPVRGFQTAGSVRGAFEALAPVFHFGAVCSDKLYFRLQGAASAQTIAFADLAAGEGKAAAEPFAPERANYEEVPDRVLITYPNYSDDYASGTETGSRNSSSTIVAAQQSNVVMIPAEAKAVAETAIAQAESSTTTAQISLSDYYARLEPTDSITVPDEDGTAYRMRIVRETTSTGVRQLDLVRDDVTSLVTTGITGGDYSQSLTVAALAETHLLLLDIPILRDVDDDPGFYAAAKGSAYGSTLFSSVDGVTYGEEVKIPTQSVFGTCTTTLGDWTGSRVFDELNTLTVNVASGTLASSTRAAMLADQSINACAIGIDGRWELCQFRTATLVSAGIYTLTGWLRGARGTEWASVDHVAAETFVVLTATGLRRVSMQQSEIGVEEWWKGVSNGRLLSTAIAQPFTDNGIGEKPFSPVDLRKSGSESDITVTWKRRTRMAPRFCGTGGINVPLGETSESYTVELRDGGNALVSTETVNTASWSGGSSTIVGTLVAPAWGINTIGGELVAIRDDQLGAYTTAKSLIRFNTDGSQIAVSATLGQEVYQWANSGDELYVATADFNTGTPTTYNNSKIQRVTRTALGSVAASYPAAVPGDFQGVACDGSSVWVSERYSGVLRKLNATTLASLATYALNAGIAALVHDSGSLWIVSNDTNEVIEWDINTTTELQRFSVVSSPFDILISGSNVFVAGANEVGCYATADGTPVATASITPPQRSAQRSLHAFDSRIAAAGIDSASLLNASTGVVERVVNPNSTYFFNVAGAYGTTLYVTTGAQSTSAQTVGYELTSSGLSGYSLTVYQIGANATGYPATMDL